MMPAMGSEEDLDLENHKDDSSAPHPCIGVGSGQKAGLSKLHKQYWNIGIVLSNLRPRVTPSLSK